MHRQRIFVPTFFSFTFFIPFAFLFFQYFFLSLLKRKVKLIASSLMIDEWNETGFFGVVMKEEIAEIFIDFPFSRFAREKKKR